MQKQWNGDRKINDSSGRQYSEGNSQAPCNSFRVGVVIPAVKDRQDNLKKVLDSLKRQTFLPEHIVVVCDGWTPDFHPADVNITWVSTEKHQPGKEQPRNVGVRHLPDNLNYVWFLDSDCVTLPTTLSAYRQAFDYSPGIERILIGPYEWMKKGQNSPQITLRNDPRWEMFKRFSYRSTFVGNLGLALGCFSGNLVWPISQFKEIGGFWNNLHAGRCEDGELGIRASAMGIPMALVSEARAFHIAHDVNMPLILKRNERDVPLINERHPYVLDEGLIVVNKDGKRFDQICQWCDEQINTIDYWAHATKCETEKIYGS